jgi:hypothetical protein
MSSCLPLMLLGSTFQSEVTSPKPLQSRKEQTSNSNMSSHTSIASVQQAPLHRRFATYEHTANLHTDHEGSTRSGTKTPRNISTLGYLDYSHSVLLHKIEERKGKKHVPDAGPCSMSLDTLADHEDNHIATSRSQVSSYSAAGPTGSPEYDQTRNSLDNERLQAQQFSVLIPILPPQPTRKITICSQRSQAIGRSRTDTLPDLEMQEMASVLVHGKVYIESLKRRTARSIEVKVRA